MKLNEMRVKNAKATGKVTKLFDGGGLMLHINSNGTKSWRLAYRFDGKQKTYVIGTYPTVSLKEARAKREEIKRMLLENIDPNQAKTEAKIRSAEVQQQTFQVLADEWFEAKMSDRSESHKYHLSNVLSNYLLPVLGKRPIRSITPLELYNVLKKIEDADKLTTAHVCRQVICRIFRYAIITGRAENDPANALTGALRPIPQDKHHPFLQDKEKIGYLLTELDKYNGTMQSMFAIRILPYVFVRQQELRLAEWKHIDLDAAEWRIPAEIMKMRKVHIVPLARQVVDLFKILYPLTKNAKYIFESSYLSKSGMPTPLSRSILNKIIHTVDGMNFQMCPHGFRSMASTILNEHGFNRDWIELQLAHTEQNSVRRAYNHAQYLDKRREMMQWYADYLDSLKEKYQQKHGLLAAI